jgi:anti-anti-sigma factor
MVIRGPGGDCRISRRRDAEGTRLVLKGSLDAGSSFFLRPMLERLTGEERRRLRVDLSHLKFMDAAGLRALLGCLRAARARGAAVGVIGAHGQPLAMLQLLRLAEPRERAQQDRGPTTTPPADGLANGLAEETAQAS